MKKNPSEIFDKKIWFSIKENWKKKYHLRDNANEALPVESVSLFAIKINSQPPSPQKINQELVFDWKRLLIRVPGN